VGQSAGYDALGRVTVWTNALGSFTNVYVGATGLIATNFAPFGKKTIFSYLDTTHDQRLQTIWNQNVDGSTLSKFDYGYDALGNITNWTQQAGTTATNVWLAQYDPVNQLLAVTVWSSGTGVPPVSFQKGKADFGWNTRARRPCHYFFTNSASDAVKPCR
jgi:hypothetical protein